ncbi:tetratricopeptide repeat protein, partial [Treponema pectinovorum]
IILTAAFLAAETGMKINQKSAGELASLILQKDEKNVDALQIKIADLIQQNKWNEAYSVSSSLIRLKNSPKNAIFTHISICLSSGKKDEAWNLIASLYEHDPKDEEVLQTFIKVLISTDRNARALKIIEQTLPSANSRLKSFLYYQKSFISTTEDAILLDLRSSLTANPRNKDALFRLYQIYFNKKEYRKAQYYLKQVVSLSPADESLLKLNSELEKLLSR